MNYEKREEKEEEEEGEEGEEEEKEEEGEKEEEEEEEEEGELIAPFYEECAAYFLGLLSEGHLRIDYFKRACDPTK